MADTNINFHIIDMDVVAVEKSVLEKSGDDTIEGSSATLGDNIAQAENLIEKQNNAPPSVEEQEKQEGKKGTQDELTPEEEFSNRVDRIKNENSNENRNNLIEARASNRANNDVAVAMMIADEKQAQIDAANEMSGDAPIYVVHGAKMVCSMGSREARLVLPLDHGIYIKTHPQMTAKDCKALTNIKCFGNCFSTENPNMVEAAAEAVKTYNEQNPTFGDKVRSVFGLAPKEKEINPTKEMLAQCICECIPKISALLWENKNEKNQVDQTPTLTQKGVITCSYGGVIKIYNNGQDE